MTKVINCLLHIVMYILSISINDNSHCCQFKISAVLKYMAQDGCDRKEAQGNMDAFLENPQVLQLTYMNETSYCFVFQAESFVSFSFRLFIIKDWAFQKVQEQNGAYVKDYANANMQPKQVILSTIWGLGVIYFIGSLIYNGIQDQILVGSFHRTMELLGME